MRRFVLGWKKLGLERSLGSRIVTYADDLVILCRRGKAEEALLRLREATGPERSAVELRPAEQLRPGIAVGPRERQRERINKQAAGRPLSAAGTRRKRRAARQRPQGRTRRSVTWGRGTEHDRSALSI